MNTITQMDVEYLKPNITIEELLLQNEGGERAVWVYNYKGTHFRVFKDKADVRNFVKYEDGSGVLVDFQTESILDQFLESYAIKSEVE